MKSLVLLFPLFFFCQQTSAQNPKQALDSLLHLLKSMKQDSNKVNVLNALSSGYSNALNDYEKAKLYADSAYALAVKLNYKKGRAVVFQNQGIIESSKGNNRAALQNFQQALALCREIEYKSGTANALKGIGVCYRVQGKLDTALKYFQSALRIEEEIKDKKSTAKSMKNIGIVYMLQGNYPDALNNFETALKIEESLGDKLGVANSLRHIGLINDDRGNYPEALRNYRAALKFSEEIGDKKGAAAALNNMGIIYDYQGNYTESLRNYLSALNIFNEIGDKNGAANALTNVAFVYDVQGNYAEAIKTQRAALKLFQAMDDKSGIALCYSNIGNTYHKLGNENEALSNQMNALNNYTEIGEKKGIAMVANNLGQIYEKKGDYAEALNKFRQSLQLYAETGHKEGIAEVTVLVGTTLCKQAITENDYLSKQKLDESIQYLNKALKLANDIGLAATVRDAYEGLSTSYKALNDYQKGLEYYTYYSVLKDSLLNNETAHKLEQQRIQFEVGNAVAYEKSEKERALNEESRKHQIDLATEQLKNEKAIEIEKLKYDLALSNEKFQQEKMLAEQKFKSEKTLADENNRHQQAMTEQKALQQKKDADANALLAERKRKYQLSLIGFGVALLIFSFIVLLIRQRNQKRSAIERIETLHKMAELELQSLRAQLNPHFMFNSLNAIQDLIVNEDNELSHLYLSRFSKLLRMLLDNANQPFVSIKQELEFLEIYLSLEKLRIPDLEFSIEKDPDVNIEQSMMPNMMLQPYIENAIWHGLSNKKGNRKLQIRIHNTGTATGFEIEDNGIGREKATELKKLFRKGHHSKGMELLSKRFSLLSKEYGASIQTSVTDLQCEGIASGTLVKIDVPFFLSQKAKQLAYDSDHHN